jgi:hypothetical protein
MIGYKGTNRDMKCRDFQYEIGKTYEIEGEPILCCRGFHFCKSLKDVFNYYPLTKDNRFFEIEADDDNTIVGSDKCVTSRIKIIREISPTELNRCYYGNGYGKGCGYGYIGNGNSLGNNSHNSGNGYSFGYGSGNGFGYGYYNGKDYGYGDGYDTSDGNGYGDGDGDSIIDQILIYK